MNVRHLSSPAIVSTVAPKRTEARSGDALCVAPERTATCLPQRKRRIVPDAVPGAATNSLSALGRAFGDRAQDGEGQTHILSETTEGTDNTPPQAEWTSNPRKAGRRGWGADIAGQGLGGGRGSGPAPQAPPVRPELGLDPRKQP